MIAKKTTKNQITLPKKIAEQFPDCDYFEVSTERGRIILRPVDLEALAKVQRKLKELGITKSEVLKAVEWARERDR
jgi:hypothetical protein